MWYGSLGTAYSLGPADHVVIIIILLLIIYLHASEYPARCMHHI